jgi:hypothetical protein
MSPDVCVECGGAIWPDHKYGTHLVAVSGTVLCPPENLGVRTILRQTDVMVVCQRYAHQQKWQN